MLSVTAQHSPFSSGSHRVKKRNPKILNPKFGEPSADEKRRDVNDTLAMLAVEYVDIDCTQPVGFEQHDKITLTGQREQRGAWWTNLH